MQQQPVLQQRREGCSAQRPLDGHAAHGGSQQEQEHEHPRRLRRVLEQPVKKEGGQ